MSLKVTLVHVADSIRFNVSLLFRVFKVIVLLLGVVQLNVEITEKFEIKENDAVCLERPVERVSKISV